jgi:hypothetical protein
VGCFQGPDLLGVSVFVVLIAFLEREASVDLAATRLEILNNILKECLYLVNCVTGASKCIGMTKKRNAKFMTSDSVENTEGEPLTAKRTAALKAIGEEETKARADGKSQTPLGADEFGMPILPTSKADVAIEVEATRDTSVPPHPANAASEPEPSTVPATKVKAAKAKTEKQPAKTVKPKADTAALFANFKSAKLVNPFKETVKDHKRFNAVAGADTFEEALPAFKDEKDLNVFVAWVLRGTPGYKR